MDVASLVASSMGAAYQAWRIGKRIQKFIQDTSCVNQTVQLLGSEVQGLGDTCESIHDQLDEVKVLDSEKLYNSIKSRLQSCQETTTSLEKLLQPVRENGTNFVAQAVRQTRLELAQDDIDQVRQTIERHMVNLQVSLQLLCFKAIVQAPQANNETLFARLDELNTTVRRLGDRLDQTLLNCADDCISEGRTIYAQSTGQASVVGLSLSLQRQATLGWISQVAALHEVNDEVESTSELSPPLEQGAFSDGRKSVASTYTSMTDNVVRQQDIMDQYCDDSDHDLEVDLVEAALRSGKMDFDSGNYQRAERVLGGAFSKFQKLPRRLRERTALESLHYQLAICAFHLHDPKTAEEALITFIQRPSTTAEEFLQTLAATLLLAQVYVKQGRLEHAREAAERVYRGRRKTVAKDSEVWYETIAFLLMVTQMLEDPFEDAYRSMLPMDKLEHYSHLYDSLRAQCPAADTIEKRSDQPSIAIPDIPFPTEPATVHRVDTFATASTLVNPPLPPIMDRARGAATAPVVLSSTPSISPSATAPEATKSSKAPAPVASKTIASPSLSVVSINDPAFLPMELPAYCNAVALDRSGSVLVVAGDELDQPFLHLAAAGRLAEDVSLQEWQSTLPAAISAKIIAISDDFARCAMTNKAQSRITVQSLTSGAECMKQLSWQARNEEVRNMMFAPSGPWLLSVHEAWTAAVGHAPVRKAWFAGGVRLWNYETEKKIFHRSDGRNHHAAISTRDQMALASDLYLLEVFSCHTGKLQWNHKFDSAIEALTFNNDGTVLAVALANSTIRLLPYREYSRYPARVKPLSTINCSSQLTTSEFEGSPQANRKPATTTYCWRGVGLSYTSDQDLIYLCQFGPSLLAAYDTETSNWWQIELGEHTLARHQPQRWTNQGNCVLLCPDGRLLLLDVAAAVASRKLLPLPYLWKPKDYHEQIPVLKSSSRLQHKFSMSTTASFAS